MNCLVVSSLFFMHEDSQLMCKMSSLVTRFHKWSAPNIVSFWWCFKTDPPHHHIHIIPLRWMFLLQRQLYVFFLHFSKASSLMSVSGAKNYIIMGWRGWWVSVKLFDIPDSMSMIESLSKYEKILTKLKANFVKILFKTWQHKHFHFINQLVPT